MGLLLSGAGGSLAQVSPLFLRGLKLPWPLEFVNMNPRWNGELRRATTQSPEDLFGREVQSCSCEWRNSGGENGGTS